MSQRYFATFITGVQDVVGTRLQHYPQSQIKLLNLQDGIVMFESTLSGNQLSELRFFNNVYQWLQEGGLPDLPHGALVTLRARVGSQPAEVPANLRRRFIDAGFQLTAHRPQYEFLWWQRNDGQLLWGQMLPRAGFKTRHLEAGELRPELAHILGLVAALDAKHRVLDPFAGYGAIARECLQGFHCNEVIAVEHNEHLIPHLKSIPRLVALYGDAGQLAHIQSSHIDRIITDPPWGEFTQLEPGELRHLYRCALIQMHRVLRAKGAAVILTAADFLPELAEELDFAIEKQYPILVSGKKATIYKLRKIDN